MADLVDLWLKTQSGFVRVDQVVHTHVRGSDLRVTLSLLETDSTSSITDINQVTHVVGNVAAAGDAATVALVEYISLCRAQGKRGVISMREDTGHFVITEFDSAASQ
ncbi:hypothetical protein [Amycolatopsis sp. CA-230715]|uniref:hypothetical protein n=1 Tax=Amycolatopsis sp. CA-230715 TaxID=2745196 RepID=UPI001C017A08|nr:hypothetical protein [Amycolatopsis sp. CA-230715]QWF85606.1 hypothetical protein HUW46_09061 [Amycolatopsis sp. CA-230715]